MSRVVPVNQALGSLRGRGWVSRSGRSGTHSPYTQALLEHLEEPGLEINLLFRKVRGTVLKLTKGEQEPYEYGALPAESLYFKAAQQR